MAHKKTAELKNSPASGLVGPAASQAHWHHGPNADIAPDGYEKRCQTAHHTGARPSRAAVGAEYENKRPPGVLHEGQIADSSGRSKVGLCPTWARRVLLHTRRLGRTRSPWMLGHQRPPARRCGNGACRPGRGASPSNLCVELAARKSALFSCHFQI